MSQDILDVLLSPEYMIRNVLEVHKSIDESVRVLPELAFAERRLPEGKSLSLVDSEAEFKFQKLITGEFGGDRVLVLGEESIRPNLDLRNETRTCLLVDMIDGTDLLERGFSNWCSAIVIFTPREMRIEGAYVVQRSDFMDVAYYATRHLASAFKREVTRNADGDPILGRSIELKGPVKAKDRSLRDAAVCMYGQRSNSLLGLLELSKKQEFITWLRENVRIDRKRKKGNEEELRFRFYDLAGNPMMVKLAEGGVDVVFDLMGQAPHDVVPGTFIALRSGAKLGDRNGKPLTETELTERLLTPAATESQVTYVLAANEEMLQELVELLS